MSAKSVFINCPFDSTYDLIFNAIVFTVLDCGFVPQCAKQRNDAGEVHLEKILRMVDESPYGIHDLSFVALDASSNLPRFNMPFELGLFIAYQRLRPKKRKSTLIMDADKYRYQKFLSDIAGQDIHAHHNDPLQAIRVVRDWLRMESGIHLPGGQALCERYMLFQKDLLPQLLRKNRLLATELTYADYIYCVREWLHQEPSTKTR